MFKGIVTAKHCLTDGDNIAIRGYKANFLNSCKIYVSKNEDIDLAYIETGEQPRFTIAEPHILDDVLVMGYPKVSFFLNFCTGEKATISAMAELRMTPTLGSIAAEGEIYFPHGLPKLLLVTAKIRGGNSGGPIINKEGLVVGVATGIPAGEGLSDDNVGYGMAYPILSVEKMISEKNIKTFNFVDYPD
jgi:S1-C subfamily serine protease